MVSLISLIAIYIIIFAHQLQSHHAQYTIAILCWIFAVIIIFASLDYGTNRNLTSTLAAYFTIFTAQTMLPFSFQWSSFCGLVIIIVQTLVDVFIFMEEFKWREVVLN
jgi:hypothetical protein